MNPEPFEGFTVLQSYISENKSPSLETFATTYKGEFAVWGPFANQDWSSVASGWQGRFRKEVRKQRRSQVDSTIVPKTWKAIFEDIESTVEQDQALQKLKKATYMVISNLAEGSADDLMRRANAKRDRQDRSVQCPPDELLGSKRAKTNTKPIEEKPIEQESAEEETVAEVHDDSHRRLFDDYESPPYDEDSAVEVVVTVKSIWDQWQEFLDAAQRNESLHQLTAEKHGVVICGEGVRPRKNMPFDAYVELCKVINTTKPRSFRETFGNELALVDTVLDAKSDDMLDSARRIACFPTESSRKDYSTFLSDMFVHIIKEIYIAKPDLAHSEAILNQAVVWPAIRATLHAINDTHDDLSFYPGEEQLQSMTTQRRVNDGQHDERSVYKADAIIRTSDGLEIALAETSNGYNEGTQSKVFFDFHKGIYGAASMLKTIADRYKYANYSLMSELKIFFWHIHSTKIRLWSLSCPSPGIFIVYREDSCVIPVSFNDDQKIPLDYIRFIWCFKEQLDQIMRTLHVLRESHQLNMKQYRYYPLPADKDLSEIVKPSIIKVTEKVHSK